MPAWVVDGGMGIASRRPIATRADGRCLGAGRVCSQVELPQEVARRLAALLTAKDEDPREFDIVADRAAVEAVRGSESTYPREAQVDAVPADGRVLGAVGLATADNDDHWLIEVDGRRVLLKRAQHARGEVLARP